jgi:hypothetical protein
VNPANNTYARTSRIRTDKPVATIVSNPMKITTL